jgi:hypothetical protein
MDRDEAIDAAFNHMADVWQDWDREAAKNAFLASLDASGFAVVPKEATEEMLDAGWQKVTV